MSINILQCLTSYAAQCYGRLDRCILEVSGSGGIHSRNSVRENYRACASSEARLRCRQ
jgi:hypothetical protein